MLGTLLCRANPPLISVSQTLPAPDISPQRERLVPFVNPAESQEMPNLGIEIDRVPVMDSVSYARRLGCTIGQGTREMMTLRIEKTSDVHGSVVRLSGRLAAEHRAELVEQIASSTARIALDLEEVTLVDLDVVQFLARCEGAGMELLHCPAYIREWISRENDRGARSSGVRSNSGEI